MKIKVHTILPLSAIVLISCAPHTSLAPLGRGNRSVHLSAGGPVVKAFGARIPVPYATAGADLGVGDRVNLNGHVHLLAAAYQMGAFDIGASWFPVTGDGKLPTVGLSPGLIFLSTLKSDAGSRIRLLPFITATAAWSLGRTTLYGGLDLALPLNRPDYDPEAPGQIYSPFFGWRWPLGRRTGLCTEIKWSAVNLATGRLAVDYLRIGDRGALALLFSLERSLP